MHLRHASAATWIAILLCGILAGGGAGCGSDGGSDSDRDRQAKPDRDTNPGEPTGEDCRCDPGQFCDLEGEGCIDDYDLSSGERYGRLELVRTERVSDEAIARVDVGFRAFEPLPDDPRQEYYTDEDERCALDMGADDYPAFVAGRLWPASQRLGIGELTIAAEGAPGSVVLEEYKTGYYTVTDPDAQSESFDPEYLPLGAAVQIEAAGGDDLAALALDGVVMPDDFEVTAPLAMDEGEEPLSRTQGITVRWTPGQATATMEIAIKAGANQAHLTCLVEDDGEATIPAEGVMQFGSKVNLALRRLTPRYRALETDEGETVYLYVIGSHLRVVPLCIGSCASAIPSPFEG